MPVATLHAPALHSSFKPEQSRFLPGTQIKVARLQVSTPLQALPSSQSLLVSQGHAPWSLVQPPSFSEQLSTEQAMPSLHFTSLPPHLPPLHLSLVVQVRPSLQVVPSALAGLEHLPVATSQVPTEWQLSSAVHTTPLAGCRCRSGNCRRWCRGCHRRI